MYTSPESTPFEIFQYSPLSQSVLYTAFTVFDFSLGEDSYKMFVLSRVLILIYNLLTLAFCFAILKRIFKLGNLLCFGAITLLFGTLYQEFISVRPDALYILFAISSLYFFLKFVVEDGKMWTNLVLFSSLLTAALFTKQSAIQYYVIYGAASLFLLPLKDSLKVILSSSIALAIALSIAYLTYGDIFFANVVGGVSLPIDLIQGFQIVEYYLLRWGIVSAFSLIGAIFWILRSEDKRRKVLALFVMGTFGFGLVTCIKVGAGPSYFNEFHILAVIASALLIKSLIEQGKSLINLKVTLTVLVVGLIGLYASSQLFHYYLPDLQSTARQQYEKERAIGLDVKKIISERDVMLFTPKKHIKNIIPTKTILPNTEFYPVSSINFEEVRQMNREKKLAILINKNELNSFRTLSSIKISLDHFVLYKSYGNLGLYLPIK